MMKSYLIFFTVAIGLSFVLTDQSIASKKVTTTNNESIKTDKPTNSSNTKFSAAQKRIGQGYSYSKPNRFTAGNGADSHRFESKPYRQRGRIVTKHSGQITPFNTYGVPEPSQTSVQTPTSNNHPQKYIYDETYKVQNGYYKQNEPTSEVENQQIQSIMSNVGSENLSPIASQNTVPFGTNTANYLPPKNQRLPVYAEQTFQNYKTQSQSPASIVRGHRFNVVNQNGNSIQSGFQNYQISDAAQFLEQNAQAISKLYTAPAPNEKFAPINDEILDDPQNSFDHNTLQNYQFRGSLPAYASGVLNTQDLSETIQTRDKDRLIAQLQQALAAQQESSGRYDHNRNYHYQHENTQPIFSTQFPIADKSNSGVEGKDYYGEYVSSASLNGVPDTIYGYSTSSVPAPTVTQPTPTATSISSNHIESTHLFNPAIGHYEFPRYSNFLPNAFQTQWPIYGNQHPNFATINNINKPTQIDIPVQTPNFKPSITIPTTSTHVLTIPSFPTELTSTGSPFELPVSSSSIPSRPVHSYQPSLYPTSNFGSNYLSSVPVTSPLDSGIDPSNALIHPTYRSAPSVINSLYKPNSALPIIFHPNSRRRSHKKTHSAWKYAPSYS